VSDQPADPIRQVAAWDFDGTITRRDTLGGFLLHVAGRRRVANAVARHATSLARGLGHNGRRDEAKAALLNSLLGGRRHDDLVAAGRSYATRLTEGYRPTSLEQIDIHRAGGHELVIVSASLRFYLDAVGEQLGFDHVIGVEMAVDATGHLTGALARPNVRAEEKAVRLSEWLMQSDRPPIGESSERAPSPVEIWAYGNSSGDDALLAMADHPTRVE